jgi:phage terminase large subunit-like protein
VAFDEQTPQPGFFRKLRTASVESCERIVQPCYRITMTDGRTVVASAQHRWYGMRHVAGQLKGWVSTEDLRVGSRIRDLGQPWEPVRSWDAGYLAGVFDGEGSFHDGANRTGFRIAFGQLPGKVMETTRALLVARGYDISPVRKHACGVDSFEIRGLYDCMRFLGECRPCRLLGKARGWYEGKAPSRGGYAVVQSLDYLGESEVVAIGTSTKTLFAEGLWSHNSAAADKDQAGIVFNVAKQMVVQSPRLFERTEIFKNSMLHLESASSYRVLSSDAFTKHGLNAHGIVVDEVHAQRHRELIDVLSTSTGARRQPVEVYITTAGYDKKSICWELHQHAERVIKGIVNDPFFLPVIFAASPTDDWRDPKVWAKANPGLGKSIKLSYLEAECQKAIEIAAYENTFKRLHLNIWTSQESRWLQLETAWDPCNTPVLELELLRGRRAWVGVDLSSTTDITAVVFLVEDPDEEGEFDVVPFFFVPEERLLLRAKRDRVEYDVWRDQELIIATEGNVVDYEAVRKKVNDVGEILDIQEIAIDRWNSTGLQTQLMGDGFNVVKFGQGFASMSGPTKELERLLLQRKLRHGGHPVLRWMADNVATSQDPAGNIKPDKAKSTERIDGIVALVMAIGRALTNEAEEEPQYQAFFLGA